MEFDFDPLGGYEQFRRWRSPVPWGPEGTWRAQFGARVVEDFVTGLREARAMAAGRYSAKAEPMPLVLGCVPWLTSEAVVDALLEYPGCCICVDKKSDSWAARRLVTEGGVGQELVGLEFFGPADEHGEGPWIGPSGPSPGHERLLEGVRVVGWRQTGTARRAPLLHAKLCVVVVSWTWENDGGGWDNYLTPVRTWMGSANWTTGSAKHLEFGAWTEDARIGEAALGFLKDVILMSEPPDSLCVGPEPQLVEGRWDDEAFAEYAADLWEEPPY